MTKASSGAAEAFEREVELGPHVHRWLARFCTEVVEELDSDAGVADLVGAVLAPSAADAAIDVTPVVDVLQLSVLDRCSSGATEQELREWAPSGWRRLRSRAVDPLVDLGMITVSDGWFHTATQPSNPFDELVAVELKLRAWNRGIAQAGAYRTFANRTWVAVPAARITAALIGHAAHNTVGVLAIHRDGSIEEIAAASSRKPLRPRSAEVVAQRILARRGEPAPRPAGSSIC